MGSHVFETPVVGADPSREVRPVVPSWVELPVLRLDGRVEGTGLIELGTMLDAAVTGTTGQVTIDVAGVDHWSLLAQAMVLNTAIFLAHRGRRLVLVGPSPALRDQSTRLQLFERVSTDTAH